MLGLLLLHVAILLTVTAQQNLARFGWATQSSQYGSAGPKNAVNRPISNEWGYTRCTHTSPTSTPAWWMFNISYGIVFITDIKIYYREGFARRMHGFKLYVSNSSTTPPSASDLCYKDPLGGPYPAVIQTIPCYQLGQYVIYYDDVPGPRERGSVIELCYVAINGCQKTFRGSNCTKSCRETCIDQHCYPGTGLCVWGCRTKHCFNDRCDKNTAICTYGCKEKRAGLYCNKYNIATDALVSQNPIGTKPTNLAIDGDKSTCSKTKGTDVWFQVDMTEIRIVTEFYITGKVNTTTNGLVHKIYASNSSAEPEKGTVLYQGKLLPQNIKTYAVLRYLTYIPAIKTASLELEMCDIGIVGCPSTQYGPLCELRCPAKCLGPCDLDTGRCIFGCLNGWIGEKCDQACSAGFYGSGCLQNCSLNCVNPSCHHTNGECIDGCNSGWKGFNCTQGFVSVRSELQGEYYGTAIGGGIGAMIAVILIMFAGFGIYKDNKKLTKDKYSDQSKSSLRSTLNRNRESNHVHEYVNAAITSDTGARTVRLEATTEETELLHERDTFEHRQTPIENSVNKIHIEKMKEAIIEKQKDEGFEKEYQILPKGLIHAHVEGSNEVNKDKNRFRDLWPYDHSRIVLKGNKKTDYINANYINNYDKEKAYIATQGPKKNTVRDFWHMIWQENVGKIVMVTQLKEGRRNKCVQYWPDVVNEQMVVDNYRLTLTKEKEHTLYVYRLITIFNHNDTNRTERKVHQFHFTQWPDHGVPDSIKLVHFYRNVKSEHCDQNGPMVVHCSAGIGRTGTFIAIDALYENGKKTKHVNIMEYVQMMRKDRMNMIQTHEQYATVFEALLELFTVPNTSIKKSVFCKHVGDQECMTLPKNRKMFKLEFQRLETLRPAYHESKFSAAKLKENISKNWVVNILPHDNFRPYLMSYGRARTDYINAVIIPGHREESTFFVTQSPLKDTVVDFWTMIYDHNSRIVVLLDQVFKNAQLWLGRLESLEFDNFSITQEGMSDQDELKISLFHKKHHVKRIIKVLKTSDWQSATIPSTRIILDLLKSVANCSKSQNGPITVVCRDGCTKSGLFVALYLILDKMAIDEEIDIFQVVRNIQTRRPEFLKMCEQYEYCYRCIKEYLEGESLYANT
ncbi:receptor-type tyrosine-protein phosphatase F-like [Mytilus edulis]|uniref:receptor-type tyrosine-protein phosphatase F-like n=1 Tax=Mytilus edulis TaxID=6550 RepID=UPI0039EFDFE3